MKTYAEWLEAQTPERREAAIDFWQLCILHGEEQRKAPFSDECKRLSSLIRKYYENY